MKAVVLTQLAGHPLLRPEGELDSAYYVALARQAAGGDWLLGTRVFFVSPLYVYFLALVLAVGGSLFTAQLVQISLGTLAVGLVWATARRWFGTAPALAAAVLAGFTGYFTFNESLLLQSSLDPFLAALTLYLLTRACQSRDALVWWIASGASFGLHALNRPNVLIPAAAVGAAVLLLGRWAGRWNATGRFVRAGSFAVGLALALAPSTLRNAVVAGEFAPVSSHGGLNFYIGNNAGADGTYKHVAGITPSIVGQDRDSRQVAEAAERRRLTDSEVSRHFYGLGLQWIASEPARAAVLFVRKLAYTFNAADVTLNHSYAFYRADAGTWLPLLFIGSAWLIPLGCFGWLVAGPRILGARAEEGGAHRGRLWWLWSAYVPAYALGVAVFFVTGRYRIPLLVALCVTAAPACSWLFDVVRRRHGVAGAGPAALILLLMVGATNWPTGLDDGREAEQTAMLLALVDARRDDDAALLLARAEPESREPALLLTRVAGALLERGDRVRAIGLLQRANRLEPESGDISLALGRVLSLEGRSSEALVHLRRAYQQRTDWPGVAVDLARTSLAAGYPDEARRAIESIDVTQLPAPLLGGVARIALDAGALPLADQASLRAVASWPGDAVVLETRGLVLTRQGRVADAIAVLEEACAQDAQSASARLNLAALHAETGHFAAARLRLGEALRLRPDYPQARALLGALPR